MRGIRAWLATLAAGALLAWTGVVQGQPPENSDAARPRPPPAQQRPRESDPVSPARRIERNPNAPRAESVEDSPYRSIDGSGNSLSVTATNRYGTPLRRWLAADYADDISAIAAPSAPGPREISNALGTQTTPLPNRMGATDFLWQWGQFLDHDFALTDGVEPAEHADISIPAGDRWFDPTATGEARLAFNRSIYDIDSGTSSNNVRQQLNEVSGWIDASQVYGSDSQRAKALRDAGGRGHLQTSANGLLPYNLDGLANAGGSGRDLFLAGDVRANEQVGLTAMHTLFVREHNRLVDQMHERNSTLNGEVAYQEARRMVGALMQVITYREFLPLLLGRNALPPYRGYRPQTDARVANAFSTAGFRLGHSLLSTRILRLDENLRVLEAGHLPLRDAFFAPHETEQHGIEPVLRGLSMQLCQNLDPFVVDDVRNFLFGAPGADGFDLIAMNIQRGRDHGLPRYNQARRLLGLSPASDFSDVSSSDDLQQRLASVYSDVEQIDLWVGGLAEDHVPGAMVGELFRAILVHQFTVLRDGDRFWYEQQFRGRELQELRRTTLADVIRRNTRIDSEIPDDVFRHLHRQDKYGKGKSHPGNRNKD